MKVTTSCSSALTSIPSRTRPAALDEGLGALRSRSSRELLRAREQTTAEPGSNLERPIQNIHFVASLDHPTLRSRLGPSPQRYRFQ